MRGKKGIKRLLCVCVLCTYAATFVYSQDDRERKRTLVIVPLASSGAAQIVGDLVAHKMLVIAQTHEEVKRSFETDVVFSASAQGKEREFRNTARRYFSQGKDAVVVVWIAEADEEGKHAARVLFYRRGCASKMAEKTMRASRDEVVVARDFFDFFSVIRKKGVVKSFLEIKKSRARVGASPRTTVRINTIWKNREETPEFCVVVNGDAVENFSPRAVTLHEERNFVEIMQDDIVTGTFFIRPQQETYLVEIPLFDAEGLKKKKKEADQAFFTKMITTDVMGSYFFGGIIEGTPTHQYRRELDFVGSVMRVAIHPPKVPQLRIGIEIPMAFSPEMEPNLLGVGYSFFGIAAIVGYVFPLAKQLELAVHGGGGVLSVGTEGDVHFAVESKEAERFSIAGNIVLGTNLVYALPVRTAGFLRFIVETSFHVIFMDTPTNVEKRTSAGNVSNLRVIPQMVMGISAGLGYRF